MNCREVKKILRKGHFPVSNKVQEMEHHALDCIKCKQELIISNLINALISDDVAADSYEYSPWDEVRLVNQIKSRIHTVNEHKSGTWDAAVIGIRGWLLAFGAMAIFLLMLISQFPADSSGSDKVSRTNPNWSEEFVSTNSSPNLPLEEDADNAH